MDNELVALLYRAPAGARETTEASLRVIKDLSGSLARIPTDMGHGGDRAQIRAKTARLFRYLAFKAEWYYNLGMPDACVRYEDALGLRLLRPLFLGKHKIEHYRLWFREPLRAAILEILTDPAARSRSYLDQAGFARLIDEFAGNRRNCVDDISRVVTLELVQRVLTDRRWN